MEDILQQIVRMREASKSKEHTLVEVNNGMGQESGIGGIGMAEDGQQETMDATKFDIGFSFCGRSPGVRYKEMVDGHLQCLGKGGGRLHPKKEKSEGAVVRFCQNEGRGICWGELFKGQMGVGWVVGVLGFLIP